MAGTGGVRVAAGIGAWVPHHFGMFAFNTADPAGYGLSSEEDFCGSLYHLLETKYRLPIEWGEEQISASRASSNTVVSSTLRLAPGSRRLDFRFGPTPLAAGVRPNLFLAFKEALSNVVRHAEASEVRMTLTRRRHTHSLIAMRCI